MCNDVLCQNVKKRLENKDPLVSKKEIIDSCPEVTQSAINEFAEVPKAV